MNLPNAPYQVVAPNARDAAPYLPWLIDKAVRLGRNNGYAQLVDPALTAILRDLGVTQPAGGFVDSDGRNARGVQNGGFNADGYNNAGFDRNGRDRDGFDRDGRNADGLTRDEAIDTMVDGWSADTAAAVLTALAGRVG